MAIYEPYINKKANANTKIIVGISGGVDSSVAASLLIQQGYAVEGMFMKNWEEDDDEVYCSADEDLQYAQQVASTLNIKLHTVNFAKEYWDHVFAECLSEFKLGRTPNPDILCNSQIKFKYFLEYAKVLGAQYIATGHYAKIDFVDNKYLLKKASYLDKDQSYFLYALDQQQLSQSIFPLANLSKPNVRKIAKQQQLITYDKKDSTGICFVGKRNFREFISKYLPAQQGVIKTIEGKSIGQHQGAIYYTLGQRQGLNIGGVAGYSEAPWFVADKDVKNNILYVTQEKNYHGLYKQQLEVSSIHWIAGSPPADNFSGHAKIRYRQPDQACQISKINDKLWQVEFINQQRAITPGQSVVFYDDDGETCLGGGIIE